MKFGRSFGVLLLLAGCFAYLGYSLAREGASERTRMAREFSSDPGPLDFMTWYDPEGGFEWCATACFDPPTGCIVFFRVPAVGFGWLLISVALVISVGAAWFGLRQQFRGIPVLKPS